MPLPFSFSTATAPVTTWLDANFAAIGSLTPIACTSAGSNTVTLTPLTDTPTISAYENYQPFSFIVVLSNTGAVTLRSGSLSFLNVYKDGPTGPIALSGGELVAGNAAYVVYDSALNTGSGGFHLMNPASGSVPGSELGSIEAVTVTVGTTLTAAQITGAGTGQSILLRSGSIAAGFIDTTDTASNIIAAIAGAVTGTVFRTRYINTTGQTGTITANTGVSVAGTTTTANNVTHDLIGIVVGASSVNIYG